MTERVSGEGTAPEFATGFHSRPSRPADPAPRETEPAVQAAALPGGTEWVGLCANRGSGSGGGTRLVDRLRGELERYGLSSEVAWTPAERKALVAAAAPGSGCRCLVAVGGDGTVSALVNERPAVPVTFLPAGTENLAARHFGLKRNPAGVARTIAAGRRACVDVGVAAGRRFLLMVGFGFDGDVVTRHHRSRISRTGSIKPTHRAAYVEPILRASLCYRFPPIHLTITDAGREEVLSGTTAFVFNLPCYALGLPFAPHARQDDGLLDLVVFRDPGPFQALYYLWRVFRGTHLEHPGVYHRRVRRVVVSSKERVPVQLDGDPAGSLAHPHAPHVGPASQVEDGAAGWIIEVIPHAIEVLVPAPRTASEIVSPLARTSTRR